MHAGLDVRGFVLSHPTPTTDASAATNAETIATLTGLTCWGVLPHAQSPHKVASSLRVDDVSLGTIPS
jgi:dethiobiotin synthetase